jgi:hypothetical protein
MPEISTAQGSIPQGAFEARAGQVLRDLLVHDQIDVAIEDAQQDDHLVYGLRLVRLI